MQVQNNYNSWKNKATMDWIGPGNQKSKTEIPRINLVLKLRFYSKSVSKGNWLPTLALLTTDFNRFHKAIKIINLYFWYKQIWMINRDIIY